MYGEVLGATAKKVYDRAARTPTKPKPKPTPGADDSRRTAWERLIGSWWSKLV
ncbi:hypothetical protein ACH41E_34130 [Streptomyces sp. NPDC020412]|uniref:hypothetical protein n=1 Tax=Streptomyces sp. NPDC020412 TaxID=3365073 RepID=UPI0037980B1A